MADSVLILLAVLPALLVAFLYKIVTLPQELSVPTPPPEPPPEPDPSAPRELASPARPLWQAPAAHLPGWHHHRPRRALLGPARAPEAVAPGAAGRAEPARRRTSPQRRDRTR